MNDQEKQAIVNEYNARVAKGGETKKAIILDLAKKHKFGYSTFGTWQAKFNGQAKRKVSKRAVKAIVTKELTNKEGQEWEVLFNDYIAKRDAATEAKKALIEYTEQLR